MDNNNKQLFARLYGVAIVLILSVLSLSVQAQYRAEPTDFDRLLSGEFNAVAPPNVTNSNCDTGPSFDCSGVLYLRLSPTLNIGGSTVSGGNQLVVRMEARAGQEAIGSLQVPAVPARCEGGLFDTTNESVCVNNAGGTFVPGIDAIPGAIDADNPANLLYNVEARFTYSKEIFPGNPDSYATVCTGATAYLATQVSPIPPRVFSSSSDNGVITHSYESFSQGLAPGAVEPNGRVQYPADDYAELMTLTCNFPASASNQLLGMSYHLSAYGNLAFGHHIGADLADSYVTSPENSLEFFPLDGSNYIAHAEITEGGTGVMIEYAEAVTENTGTYQFTAAAGNALTLTPSAITWLNDRTVWLTLGSDIYGGVNTGSDVALDADRNVLVSSTYPDDTSFGDNFGRSSTYRAVLTRHMSQVDLDQTAPRITGIEVADGTESIALTFSEAVCGATEVAGCTTLTVDHFEVMHYGGTETATVTPLTISSVDVTDTVATLGIDLPGSVTIDTNDYVLVRTAKNSRFSDGFITDRTIFSESSTQTSGGMLHLQSGALAQAIPEITYPLPANLVDVASDSADVVNSFDGSNAAGYSIDEGDASEDTTVTFMVTQAPDFASTPTVTITNTAGGNPEGFGLWVGGVHITGNFTTISQPITFNIGEDEQTIIFMWTGDDDSSPDPDNEYEILIGDETITFTIEDDERGIDVVAPDLISAISEMAVENEGVQAYTRIYSDTISSDTIIGEVGVTSPNEFSITEIVLSITDSDGVVVVRSRPDNSSLFDRTESGNEFTFRNTAGVAIAAAETFLKSLEFGISNDEPTGFLTGSTTPRPTTDVTVALAVTAIDAASEEADDTETVVRTINEENDPVELDPLGNACRVVSPDDLLAGSTFVIGATVNDGGDDSGIARDNSGLLPVRIDPETFPSLTAANGGVGTLTLSGSRVGEDFTLTASSDVELEATEPGSPLMTELTFSDGRSPTASEEIRTITICISGDDMPPTISDRNIDTNPPGGATERLLGFRPASDPVGSSADPSNVVMYTRDVDYIITIERLASGDKPMRTILSSTTMSATALGLDLEVVDNVDNLPSAGLTPAGLIEILLTRNGIWKDGRMIIDTPVVLIPGDNYMVDISVTDSAGNPDTENDPDAAVTYNTELFEMLHDFIGNELAGVDCGAGPDSDRDGIASAYERSIGTDCNGSVDDYIGNTDPANASLDAAITVPDSSPQDAQVEVAGASRYTQIDTGDNGTSVNCVGADCDKLKAFILSSGSVGNAADTAVAMVTDRCPPDVTDATSPNPSECWVDAVSVDTDGNVGTVPLQWGFNRIDWVAADDYGNLILSTMKTQYIYVAPVVVLTGGGTGRVLNEAGEISEVFDDLNVQFVQDPDGDNLVEFLDGAEEGIPTLALDSGLTNCDLTVDPNPSTITVTVTVPSNMDSTECTFNDLWDLGVVVEFGTLPTDPDPFYAVGSQITVERANETTNRVAPASIEIVVTAANSTIPVADVAFDGSYDYRVVVPSGSAEVEITFMGEQEPFHRGGTTGRFGPVESSQDPLPLYISIKATHVETSITHTVPYFIEDSGTSPEPDTDNDGVPDSDDAVPGPGNDGGTILLSEMISPTTTTRIVVPSGYRVALGNTARRNALTQTQAELNEGVVGGIGTPPGYGDENGENGEGVFEFTVYLPENTNTAFISIPLLKELDEDKGLGKHLDSGITIQEFNVVMAIEDEFTIPADWSPFDTSRGDAYYSARGVPISGGNGVTCPTPVNPSSGITEWGDGENILLRGHQCVLVVITDGGRNDNDGQLNGVIVDPGAPAGGAVAPRFGPCAPPGCTRDGVDDPTPPRSGGGAADLWFLLMLLGLIAVPVLTRQRKRLTR